MEMPPFQLRRSKRARRLQLQYTPEKGLEVVIPARLKQVNLEQLFVEHQDWINKVVQASPQPSVWIKPETIELLALNERWQISYHNRAHALRLREHPGYLLRFSGSDEHWRNSQRLLKRWLLRYASAQLLPQLHALSLETGLGYEQARVRIQKRRWGSCNTRKQINLNAQLLFLPPELVRHILLHELCHTRHLNHSSDFWNLVAQHDSAYKRNRALCRKAEQFIPNWWHQQALALALEST